MARIGHRPRSSSGALKNPLLIPTFLLACSLVTLASTPARADNLRFRDMYDVFSVEDPKGAPAVSESTIQHQVYFSDMEGSTSAWGTVDFRAGQPNAWHRVSGTHSCTGQAWWCGVTGLTYGDGYDNNWVQLLKTNTPINLAGSSGNVLTFKHRLQCEDGFDWAWVMIHDGNASSVWDTLASYSGNLGGSCINASLPIPNSWTARPQPIQLMFLFGSDLAVSRSDSNDVFTGWSIDDVQVTAAGSIVKFFDDNEGTAANWVTSSPDPGPLWHLENSPGTSVPASCFFLNTNLWVPFSGNGFGTVPDFADAMLYTPPMNITGAHLTNQPNLRLRLDDWINLPQSNAVGWSLWIQGSTDGISWTPWKNALGGITLFGSVAQCVEGSYVEFNPYDTQRTGIQPGTPFIRLGFRLRDEKPSSDGAEITRLGIRTEGIYFDNIGVDLVYTISGVEMVDGPPPAARTTIRAYPNPFNPSTTIEFSVPRPGPVTVNIFDLQGRKVANLIQKSLGSGVYRTRWGGRDEAGHAIASGIYFARVEGVEGRNSTRLLLVK